MTGHEQYNSIVEMPTRKSVKLVHESWRKKLRGTLSHTSLEVHCYQVKRCIEIALNCLISNRQERPNIQDIVSSLNETETMIGDQRMQNEQFSQEVGESTLPLDVSSITVHSGPSSVYFRALEPRHMPLDLLRDMTDNFSDELLIGRGAYGNVYKGVHRDGQISAVKKFYSTHLIGHEKLFQNAVAILQKPRHPNIVQLTGYCHDTERQLVRHGDKFVFAEEINMLLCFEYFQNGSLENYISEDMDSGLDWQTRYGILKGICEGLKYLHEGLESPIFHMDLKPSNILMGENMMPKLSDFISARIAGVQNSIVTMNIMGTIGYMPPEFIDKQVISKEYDIFSLGVITLELMTGRQLYRHEFHEMSHQEFIELAHEKWRRELQKTVDVMLVERYCQQVKKCLEIAVKCLEYDRHERPAIGDIINMLNETETSFIPLLQIDSEDSELLLEVHPLELRFMSPSLEVPSRKKKAAMMCSSCSLQLKNKGNDRVAFMLVANSPKRYLTKESLCGIVSPRCSYTLTLTMRNNKKRPLSSSLDIGSVDFFTLYSVGLKEYDLLNVDKDSLPEIYDNFFKEGKEEVEVVTLNVVCDQPTSDQHTSSSELIVTTADVQQLTSIDVHPTEPWIMTTNHVGSLRVWNYKTMATLSSFELSAYEPVHVAKFITREKWLAVGDHDGGIHVYNYEEEDIESFAAHDSCITTLAVHPTSSYVLSSSEDDDHLIKLWDWGKGWKCSREFGGHTGRVTQVTFHLENNDCFASASLDGTVKVWSICSDDPSNITLKLGEHGLCADYFTRYNRQHLIVGCKNRTAQIWELEMKGRVHELEGHEDHISAVNLHPELSVLITGSLDGTIRLWDSTTYKLENIIGFNLGAVYAFGCIKGSRRIVVGCHQGIAMIDIPLP